MPVFVIPPRLVRLPLESSLGTTPQLDLLAPQFEEQLRQIKEEDSFVGLVRRTIQDKLTGQRPWVDVISHALHIRPRTLQRRLQESGSSDQRVLDEARQLMVRYYLGDSALELNEAAYLLGFEDPNSFGRAFRGWEGVPPSDWRETHRNLPVRYLPGYVLGFLPPMHLGLLDPLIFQLRPL